MDKSLVLILESDSKMRLFFSEVYRNSDLEVCMCESAHQVMDILQKRQAAVLVTDVNLSDMSGFELRKVVRLVQSNLNIIFVSIGIEYTGQRLLENLANDPLTFFLRKPLKKKEILSLTERILVNRKHQIAQDMIFENMKVEIDIAIKMQKLMLPQWVLYDEETQLLMLTNTIPFAYLTGDYADIIPLKDGRFFFVMADIAGHGIVSAIYMSIVRSLTTVFFRSLDTYEDVLENYLKYINKNICEEFLDLFYMSCIVSIYDPIAETLTLINAGHPQVMWYNAKTKIVDWIQSTAHVQIPLGWLKEYDVPKSAYVQLPFNKDITFLFYTDGLLEGRNDKQKTIGRENIKNYPFELKESVKTPPFSIIELNKRHGYKYFHDDVTLVSLSLQHLEKNELFYKIIIFSTTLRDVRQTGIEIREILKNYYLDEMFLCKVELAFCEIANNIVVHGKTSEKVAIRFSFTHVSLKLVIYDRGVAWTYVPSPPCRDDELIDMLAQSGRGLRFVEEAGFKIKCRRFDTLNQSILTIKFPKRLK